MHSARIKHAAKRTGGTHRSHRGPRKLMALLLVLPTLVLQAATVSSAGADVTAGFEIDGNVVDDAVGGVDWNTPVGKFPALV